MGWRLGGGRLLRSIICVRRERTPTYFEMWLNRCALSLAKDGLAEGVMRFTRRFSESFAHLGLDSVKARQLDTQ